jgi:hypothetical protein
MDISTIGLLLEKIPFDIIEKINSFLKENFLKIDTNIEYNSVIFSYYGEKIVYNLFRYSGEQIDFLDTHVYIKLRKANNIFAGISLVLYEKNARMYYHPELGIVKKVTDDEHKQLCREFEKFKKIL